MIPTLRVRGDGLWISRRYAYGRGIERGDVISLHSPMMRGVSVVKRVLGMPGDFVLRDTPGPAGDRMIQVNTTSRTPWPFLHDGEWSLIDLTGT